MAFCYIKYSVLAIQMLKYSKFDVSDNYCKKRLSKQNKVFQIVDPVTQPSSTVIKSTGQLTEDSDGASMNKFTNQLTAEKSMQLLNMYRVQVCFSDTGVGNDADQAHDLNGASAPEPVRITDEPVTVLQDQTHNSPKSETFPQWSSGIKAHVVDKSSSINYSTMRRREPQKYFAGKSSRSNRKSRTINTMDNISLKINPNCYVQILMDYIHDIVNISKSVMHLDLFDEDGNMMELYKLKPYESAQLVLEFRKTYYLASYERNVEHITFNNLYKSLHVLVDDDFCYSNVDPLIKETNKNEADLLAKLKKNTFSNKIEMQQQSSNLLSNYNPKSSTKHKKSKTSSLAVMQKKEFFID